jgi:hypothetical protein
MHAALVQFDLVPLEIAYLAGAQPVPICNEHHGGIAVAVPVLASAVHKPLHLSLGQVAALNCQVLEMTQNTGVTAQKKSGGWPKE